MLSQLLKSKMGLGHSMQYNQLWGRALAIEKQNGALNKSKGSSLYYPSRMGNTLPMKRSNGSETYA